MLRRNFAILAFTILVPLGALQPSLAQNATPYGLDADGQQKLNELAQRYAPLLAQCQSANMLASVKSNVEQNPGLKVFKIYNITSSRMGLGGIERDQDAAPPGTPRDNHIHPSAGSEANHKNECLAHVLTNRGDHRIGYDWKTIDGDTYINVQPED